MSIIVPVLNEERAIRTALGRLCLDFPDCKLVVVDGGSTDATVEIASLHATVIHSERGRAKQMNAGARHCSGEVLWFVHADTEIDPAALAQIRAAMSVPEVVGGGNWPGTCRRAWTARPLTARRVAAHVDDCRRCGLEAAVYREIKSALARQETRT
ncbi:glycosyltransferase [Streptomyces sp. TRM70350]|uniref:glycosyltransferase n=1 Tax=Streptomyces sp. TRM70350 TaxID=2856165 RepID=UPI001C494056|nr:glycosyltransferase [Streptomyces sp. TRM70350]MBV7697464.1 glycosyltransferase [Streptomyces sp. TRM70350]